MSRGARSGGEFGPLEGEVMDAIWAEGGGATVRAVAESLNRARSEPLAYTTVMTVMSRLAGKNVLRRRKAGRGYLYDAAAPDAAGIAVQDVLRSYGDVALTRFVDQARADPDLLRRLRDLLEDEDG